MAAPAPSPPPQRQWVGTLRAQITGRRHYKGAAAPLGARYTLSRSNSAAQECRKYDANATVVLNSSGETVGSLARAFAACVAPVLDCALAALECTVPLQQRAGGSMRLQYNPGEQLDLDVAFFASAAELPALQALGVLARLDRASAGGGGGGGAAAAAAAAPPPPPSSTPAAKRAREPAAGCSEGSYTNLRDVAGGVFTCTLAMGGCEVVFKGGIRYPDAWLAGALDTLPDWAEEVVIYRSDPAAADVEVLRRSLPGLQPAESKRPRAGLSAAAAPVSPASSRGVAAPAQARK